MHLIISHEQSDFDAVAAMLGAWLLKPDSIPVQQARLNRNVREYLKTFYAGLPFVELSSLPSQPVESVHLVDTQSLPTLKGIGAGTSVTISDHHAQRPGLPADWLVNLDTAGACTTRFVEQIKKEGLKLTTPQATLLLLGIYEDTGSLTYSLTTPRDIHAAAYLLEQKASLKIAVKYLNPPLSESQNKLYDLLLKDCRLYEMKSQKIILCIADASGMDDEISSVVHKLRDFLNPDGLVIIAQSSEGFRLIARSTTDEINVAALTSHFGGGGHGRAAAALIQPKNLPSGPNVYSLEEMAQEVLSILPECIHPSVTVGQIMSHNPILLQSDTPAEKAAHLMQRYGYEGFPVVEDSQVVGLLTRRIVDRTLAFKLNLPAGSLMEPGHVTLTTDDSIDELQQVMAVTGWGQVPVLDSHSGKIVGIVTRTDLIKTISNRKGRNPDHLRNNLAARLETVITPGRLAFLKIIAALAEKQHTPLYIVGGFVRDLLLNRAGIDFDLVVEGDAISLGHKLKEAYGGRVISHSHFGTAKWHIGAIRDQLSTRLGILNPAELPDSIDLISARIEFYDRPTALPTIERSSIKLDLHRRDFSINTMALRLDGSFYGDLYDYWGGMNDLRQGIIRVLHSLSFVDDPTRMLRAVRFEQRFHFKIETRTLKLMKEAHNLVEDVSGDRLRHELDLILGEPDPLPALQRAEHLGLLVAIHPDLKWTQEDSIWAAGLINDPFSRDWNIDEKIQNMNNHLAVFYLIWFSRFSLSTALELVKRLRFNHVMTNAVHQFFRVKFSLFDLPAMKPGQIYQLFFGCSNLVIYSAYKTAPSPQSAGLVKKYAAEWQTFNPNIDGKELAALGIPPGPVYKQILDQIRNAWLDGLVMDRDQENQLLQNIIADYSALGRI